MNHQSARTKKHTFSEILDAWRRTVGTERIQRVGQEWHGPCPCCGGKDRAWLKDGDRGVTVFACRQCSTSFSDRLDAVGLGRQSAGRRYPFAAALDSPDETSGEEKPEDVPLADLAGSLPPGWDQHTFEPFVQWTKPQGGQWTRLNPLRGRVYVYDGPLRQPVPVHVKYEDGSFRWFRVSASGAALGLSAGVVEPHPRRRLVLRSSKKSGRRRLWLPAANPGLFRWSDVVGLADGEGEDRAAVVLAEGEKDVDVCLALGIAATCHGWGANLAQGAQESLKALRGRRVLVCYDADEAGAKGRQAVAMFLVALGVETEVLELDPDRDRAGFDLADAVVETARELGLALRDEGNELADAVLELETTRRNRLADAVRARLESADRVVLEPAAEPSRTDDRQQEFRGGGFEGLTSAVPSDDPADPRRVLYLSTREDDIAHAALVELVRSEPSLYRVNGELVVTPSDPRDAREFRVVTVDYMRRLLSRWLNFSRVTSNRVQSVPPPKAVAGGILSAPDHPGVRELRGVMRGPFLRPDGTVCQSEGYDEATGYLLRPEHAFDQVADAPTRTDARRCVDRLLDLVDDFPFMSEAHRSTWLALVLTMCARPAFEGPAPLFFAEASTAGSGKGKLLDAASILVHGRAVPKAVWPRSPEEQRKVIDSVLIQARPMWCFDNLSVELAGAEIDSVLTATTREGRVLGSSTTFIADNLCVWTATGNNARLGSDTVRRTLAMRLTPDVERPEQRTGFKYEPLEHHIEDVRHALLPAALTVLRAFYLEVDPNRSSESRNVRTARVRGSWRGFGACEGWSHIIRGCLRWLDLADPAETQDALRQFSSVESDDDAELHEALARYLETVPEARSAKILQDADLSDRARAVVRLVAERSGVPYGDVNSRHVGNALRNLRDRVFDGRRIAARQQQRALVWYLQELLVGGHGADADVDQVHE